MGMEEAVAAGGGGGRPILCKIHARVASDPGVSAPQCRRENAFPQAALVSSPEVPPAGAGSAGAGLESSPTRRRPMGTVGSRARSA